LEVMMPGIAATALPVWHPLMAQVMPSAGEPVCAAGAPELLEMACCRGTEIIMKVTNKVAENKSIRFFMQVRFWFKMD
jgi:hypothetical protein